MHVIIGHLPDGIDQVIAVFSPALGWLDPFGGTFSRDEVAALESVGSEPVGIRLGWRNLVVRTQGK